MFKKEFPKDLDECMAMLKMAKDKINEIRVNSRAIQEYEKREAEIALMKKELEQMMWARGTRSIVERTRRRWWTCWRRRRRTSRRRWTG